VSQLRLNPLNGRWVTVATERATRPADFTPRRLPVEAGPSRPCPFCPGNEEATLPALETYGRDGSWRVRVVPNLYPAFSGAGEMELTRIGPVFVQAPANGIHEVLVLTPKHDAGWAELDDMGAGLAMAAIRDRLESHSRDSVVRYTQTIVNHGREAGASLEHPHGQLLGIPFVPDELQAELDGFRRFADSEGNHLGADLEPNRSVECLLCRLVEVEREAELRVVLADERVTVVCPFWSGSPYEMLVIPTEHEGELAQSRPPDLVAAGRALRDALARLQALVGDVAYNVVFHTAPHHDPALFHWHIHVLPRVSSVAGFEQGTGVLINIVSPEDAAAQLRAVVLG
jgi:UDPglucose--hexose-1-phosphate uridylyltransferase